MEYGENCFLGRDFDGDYSFFGLGLIGDHDIFELVAGRFGAEPLTSEYVSSLGCLMHKIQRVANRH